jgi:hypothetical protein
VVSGDDSVWLRRKPRWVSVLPFRAGRQTRPVATGMVVVQMRVDLRPFAFAIDLPRNVHAINVIQILFYSHAENLTISAKIRKTYGRLLGMIFLEGSGALLITSLQRFATQKTFKNRKKRKTKCHFLSRGRPFFCQNGLKKARFCCQY